MNNLRASETGRPGLFAVMRDAALEADGEACPEKGCPYPADYCAAMRAAELWHRPPEEWELEREVKLVGFSAWLPEEFWGPSKDNFEIRMAAYEGMAVNHPAWPGFVGIV